MDEHVNLYHVHVITASLLEARDVPSLYEYGLTFKSMNLNSKTKEIARSLYEERKRYLNSQGGSDDHFSD
jgi:hypothetical protein